MPWFGWLFGRGERNRATQAEGVEPGAPAARVSPASQPDMSTRQASGTDLPKPAGYFVYGNGFVPTEDQIYAMLRAFKDKHAGAIMDHHIVGVLTQGAMAPIETICRMQGPWKTVQEFKDEAELRAFMECKGAGFWDSVLVTRARHDQAMIIVAVWAKADADVARSCLRQAAWKR